MKKVEFLSKYFFKKSWISEQLLYRMNQESRLIVFVLTLRWITSWRGWYEAIAIHWHSHLDSVSIHRTWLLLLGHIARLLLWVESLLLLLCCLLMVGGLLTPDGAIVHHELHLGCCTRVLHLLLLLHCHVQQFLVVLVDFAVLGSHIPIVLFVAGKEILEVLAPYKANVENEWKTQHDHEEDFQTLHNLLTHWLTHKKYPPKDVGDDHDENDVESGAASFSLFFRQLSTIDADVTTLSCPATEQQDVEYVECYEDCTVRHRSFGAVCLQVHSHSQAKQDRRETLTSPTDSGRSAFWSHEWNEKIYLNYFYLYL